MKSEEGLEEKRFGFGEKSFSREEDVQFGATVKMEVQISGVSCYVSSMAWIKCVETSIGSYLQISHYGGEMWGLRVVSRVMASGNRLPRVGNQLQGLKKKTGG